MPRPYPDLATAVQQPWLYLDKRAGPPYNSACLRLQRTNQSAGVGHREEGSEEWKQLKKDVDKLKRLEAVEEEIKRLRQQMEYPSDPPTNKREEIQKQD